MSSVHNATEHSYVKEQSKGCSFAISVGQSTQWSSFRAIPFSLPGLADKILNGHTLAAVQHHVLRVFLYLRLVQDADEVIVDHYPLRPVLSPALGLIHINAFHKLMQDGRRQRFHLHELAHRFQKLLFTKSTVVLAVTLTLQFLNVLFELLLFLVVPLGHFHIMLAPAVCGLLGQSIGMRIFPVYLAVFYVVLVVITKRARRILEKD